jgi:hypothetical protein
VLSPLPYFLFFSDARHDTRDTHTRNTTHDTIVARTGLCHNSSLRELHLGDNWTRNKTKARSQAVDNLIGTTALVPLCVLTWADVC